DILYRMSLPADRLKLEITETAVIANPAAAAMLGDLKSLGIELAMDDFGTGYSSLNCLHRFPLDVLKIDRSFVAAMMNLNESMAIVRTILTLAHHLGLKVVAEGVEKAEQYYSLKALGCEFGQGYYFSKPLSAEKAEALLNLDPPLGNSSDPTLLSVADG